MWSVGACGDESYASLPAGPDPASRRALSRANGDRLAYDGAGSLESVLDPLGNEIAYTLDANGNPQVVTSTEQTPGGTETYALETVFDGQNRPTARRRYAQGLPVGTGAPLVTSFGWDSRSQLVKVTDPIGRVMRTSYDLAGCPTSTVEDAADLAIATSYAHDKDDLLVGLTDPDGKVTGWIHDGLGRVKEVDYALGGSELFTHDGEDAVKTHTRQDGVVTTLTYRADGALSSRNVGSLREEFDWAAVGVPREARVLVSGLVRSRVSRTFDGLGRIATESQDDYTVAFGYDRSHNPVTVTWPDSFSVTQTFDELERLEGLSDGGGVVADWVWSGPGRVARRRTGQALKLVTTWQWDGFQRLAGLCPRRVGHCRSTAIGLGVCSHVQVETLPPGMLRERKSLRKYWGAPGGSWYPTSTAVLTSGTRSRAAAYGTEKVELSSDSWTPRRHHSGRRRQSHHR